MSKTDQSSSTPSAEPGPSTQTTPNLTKQEKRRAYYQKNKERIKQQAYTWMQANPEAAAEARRRWVEKNYDAVSDYQAAYAKANRERKNEIGRRSKQRLKERKVRNGMAGNESTTG